MKKDRQKPQATILENVAFFSRSIKIHTFLRDQNIAKARDDGESLADIAMAGGMKIQRVVAILKHLDKSGD